MNLSALKHKALGYSATEAKRWNLALVYLNKAVRAGANDLETLDYLGEVAYRTQTPEALTPYQNLYKYPSISTHMARAFLMLGDLKSATEFLNYARESALKDALHAMISMGDKIEETAAAVIPVAEKYPDLFYPEYWRALSVVGDAVKREDLVQLAERKSKANAYSDPNIHFNQALRMLSRGEFQAGWRLYEWRIVPGVHNPMRTQLGKNIKTPLWKGEDLKNKTLVIVMEQGLGDCIFSLRYIKALLQNENHTSPKLEIVSRKPLTQLVRSTFPNLVIHDEEDFNLWEKAPYLDADYWTYVLSIPYLASLWKPINTNRFLTLDQNIIDEIKNKISAYRKDNKAFNLPIYTINWHGRIDTDADRTRAYSVSEFLELSNILIKPCIVLSIQKEATTEELRELKEILSKHGCYFYNAAPELINFSFTGAFILNSDRLLTCDTSVAHLGGALGHPTTVFARNKSIWQWLPKENMKSVWYDSVDIEYALTPKISWLFTAFHKVELDKKGNQNDENHKNSELQSTDLSAPRFGRTLRFAGRTSECE